MTNITNRSSLLSARGLAKSSFVMILLCALILPVAAIQAQTITRYLSLGMSGSDVSTLQTYLAKDPSLYPQGLVTGYFGPMTKTAVINFQNRNGIDPVGRVGPATLPVLTAKMNDGITSAGPSPAIYNVTVGTSQTGATIRLNTNELASALIYYSTTPLIMIEGSAGSDVSISGTAQVVHTDQRMAHEANIAGLQSNTVYYYSIYTRDRTGNVSVTWPSTFRTNN